MQPIVEAAQPYITLIVKAVIGALAAVLLAAVGVIRSKVVNYLDSKMDADQRELLHKVAAEAFAYAETVYKSEASQVKLAQAMEYAAQQLGRRGIPVTADEIRAAIEAAYLNAQAPAIK